MVKKVQWRKGSKGGEVVKWWECSPSTNVARVQIPASTPYVVWVSCCFSPLPREVFLRVLRFSPLLNNQHVQIPIRPGIIPFKCTLQILPPPTPLKVCTQHNNKMYSLLFLFRWRWCHINRSTDITRCYWDADWAHTGWLWVVRHSQVTTCWKAI